MTDPQLTMPAWILAGVFAMCGLLSLLAAVFGWKWFFDTASAAMAGARRSRRGARIFYGVAGAAIIAAAFLVAPF